MKMKFLKMFSVFGLGLLACKDQNQNLKITGSDTVLPLSQLEAEEYMKDNEGLISVTGGGSGVGISALFEGTIDIAQSSRKIKLEERHKFESKGKNLVETIVAYDALAIIVNNKNPISKLTREQLEGIFTGEIRNWKELGGEDLEIVAYSRETSSGTYTFFKEEVLKNKNYLNGILSMSATGGIIQSVSQTESAIGYVGLAYLNDNVKAIHVSYDQGLTYVEPSLENAKNATYPIVRPLIYYYLTDSQDKVHSFLDYVLSVKGQNLVESIGYVPVNAN